MPDEGSEEVEGVGEDVEAGATTASYVAVQRHGLDALRWVTDRWSKGQPYN